MTPVGHPIKPAPSEFAVLELLMEHAGQALSRAIILEHVGDYSFDCLSNVGAISIKRLRWAVDSGH